jgi:hypothetical protein
LSSGYFTQHLIVRLISDSIEKISAAAEVEWGPGPEIASVDAVRARAGYAVALEERKSRGLPLSRWEKK